jgi:hypothetical protein
MEIFFAWSAFDRQLQERPILPGPSREADMILILICAAIAGWLFFTGFKFYRSMDWNEPAEHSPDFGEMRKKEAQLLHVQDVLQEAHSAGKLSKSALEEYTRYAEQEIEHFRDIQKKWAERERDS